MSTSTETLSPQTIQPAEALVSSSSVPDVIGQTAVGSSLDEHLKLLSGLRTENYWAPAESMDKNEAFLMAGYLLERIPTLLKQQSLSGKVKMHVEKHRTHSGKRAHNFIQQWGVVPDPESVGIIGPIVEFAGPTDGENNPKIAFGIEPDLITNVNDTFGEIDVFVDAKHMPMRDESLGGVYISCLPGAMGRMHTWPGLSTLRGDAINEATRVLKPGGYLYWLGGTPDDVDHILANGLEPAYLDSTISILEEGKRKQKSYEYSRFSISGAYRKADTTQANR